MTQRFERLYIAAPWVHREAARDAADYFRAEGFLIGARWLRNHGDSTDPIVLRREALADEEDVLDADALVLLNLGKSDGKAWEASLAYHAGIRVVVVGERAGNIFYHLPGIEVTPTVEDAAELLRTQVFNV